MIICRNLIDNIFDSVQGQLQWQVDLTRLDKWLAEDMSSDAAGRLWGTVDLLETPSGMNLLMTTTGSQLAISPSGMKKSLIVNASSVPVWIEPQVNGRLDVTRPIVNETDIDELKKLLEKKKLPQKKRFTSKTEYHNQSGVSLIKKLRSEIFAFHNSHLKKGTGRDGTYLGSFLCARGS